MKNNDLYNYTSGSGFYLFPVREQPKKYIDKKTGKERIAKEKTPYTKNGFKDATQDKNTIKQWSISYPDCMWGLATGESHLVIVDFDFYKYPDLTIPDYCLATAAIKTAHSGSHLVYYDNGYHISSGQDVLGPGIDIRAEGGYSILPPSTIIKEWNSGSPIDVNLSYTWSNNLPIINLPDELAKLLLKKEERIPKLNNQDKKTDISKLIKLKYEVSKALDKIGNKAKKYLDWLHVGMALFSLGDDGLELWINWSKKYSGDLFDEDECREKWLTFDNEREDKYTTDSIFYWSNENKPIENQERFKLGSALDAFNPRPPINFIIENVVKEVSLNSWFGKYGHKKTFTALSAGVCVAAGLPWIGLNTIQCPVLFIDEESGTRTLLDRLEAAIKGESQDKNIPFYYLSLSAFNFFKNNTDIDFLKKYIIQTKAKLIFIDAFDDVMAGSDENGVKDNQPVLIQLRKICEETNSALIFLHHTNKKSEIRGSTSIPGSLNSALKIESENGSSSIKISTEKMRDSKTFSKNAKIVYIDNDKDPTKLESFYLTEDETPFDENITERQKIILDYMKTNNGDLIITEFLKTIQKEKKESFRVTIYELRDKGIINKNPDKSEHNKTVFTIG